MCAVDFKKSQRRSRLFFIGRRREQIPAPPSPHTKNPITVRQAIFDLPVLKVGSKINELGYRSGPSSAYAREMRQRLKRCTGHLVSTNNGLVVKRYQHIPQGGNWCDIPARLMQNYSNMEDNRSRHTGIYHRLCWDEPSVVIANYRKNMLVHPEQNRGLSVREAARLQSFPDRYRFCGSIGFQQQQVGNAVPPRLAKAVFERIIEAT